MSRTRIVKGKLIKITHKDHYIYSRGAITNNASTKVIQVGENDGVFYGNPNFPDLKYEQTDLKLESSFAHNQLVKTAKELSEMTFVLIMLQIFGNEIEVEAVSKLYKDLCDGKTQPPEIIVTKDPIKTYKANYSNKRKKILVSKGFLEDAIEKNEVKAELMASLVEEFGHHIDNLLRTDYATNSKEDKDKIDEGAKFAYYLLTVDFANTPQLEFAETETPQYTGKLVLDMSPESQDLAQFVDQHQWYDGKPFEDIESFGFGFNHGTHGGIEMTALNKPELFAYEEVLKIYYGNWLRDVSQVLVADSIRLTTSAREYLEQKRNKPNTRVAKLLASNTNKISHDGWVKLIEFFAAKEFGYTKNDKIKTQNYAPHLKLFRETYGTLTKDILGIYRPEEHIDNPKDLTDDRIGQTMFCREVPGGVQEWDFYAGEHADSFKTNKYGQKAYIFRDDEDVSTPQAVKDKIPKDLKEARSLRPSSDIYMSNELRLAVQKGKNKDGFRHFGAALHVLEDYFSHTNFVEISLRKLGYDVYPWVEGMQKNDPTTGKPLYKNIPIVTGKFLLDDTCASVVPKMADMLFPIGFTEYELRKPGERTFGEQTIYTILKDLSDGQKQDPSQSKDIYLGMDATELLTYYEKVLLLSDKLKELQAQPGVMGTIWRTWGKITNFMGDLMTNYTNIVFNILIESVDDDIKETQTHVTNKNYGENPTHTQIGKDSHEHLLNGLAAELAVVAVEDVGKRIKDTWEGRIHDPTGDELAKYVLTKYSRHPKDATWMEDKIKKWASTEVNKPKLEKLKSPTIPVHYHNTAKRKVNLTIDKIKELIDYYNKAK